MTPGMTTPEEILHIAARVAYGRQDDGITPDEVMLDISPWTD